MDNNIFAHIISQRTQLAERQVAHTLELLADGATIPFIARYRKERTGGLDEVQISTIAELGERLSDIAKRKATIVNTITEQQRMTPGTSPSSKTSTCHTNLAAAHVRRWLASMVWNPWPHCSCSNASPTPPLLPQRS